MDLALIVIPDRGTLSREHRLDEALHLVGPENPTPWIDQRNAVAAELESSRICASGAVFRKPRIWEYQLLIIVALRPWAF